MGMELLSSLSRSTCCTCFRNPTKCELRSSEASGDNLGAQRLRSQSYVRHSAVDIERYLRFTESHVSLHLVNVDFSDCFFLRLPIHVDVHDVLGNSLWDGTKETVSVRQISFGSSIAYSVSHLVVLILNDEDHIETRQDGRLEVDVLEESGYQHRRSTRIQH